MQAISKLNPELAKILTEFSDFFYGRDFSHLEPLIGKTKGFEKIAIKEKMEEATSLDYLIKALDNPKEYGYPRYSWGLELVHDRGNIEDKQLIEMSTKTNSKLMDFFGARNNALQMFYPTGGYIGWHHNGNAPGYNIVLSCNPGADGEFESWDLEKKELVVFKDQPGWNCKVGYFGDLWKEPDQIFWHCARTRSPRLTFSYVIYDKNLWQDMVDDINYDR